MGLLPIRIKKKVVSEEELRARKEQDIEKRKELEKQADFYTSQAAEGVPMPTVPMVSNPQAPQYTSSIQQPQPQQQVRLVPPVEEKTITIDSLAKDIINMINGSSNNIDERNAMLDLFLIEFLKASELKPVEKIRLLEGLKFL